MAFRTIATAATILCVLLPATTRAQDAKTACNDGTTTTATGSRACDGHGGLHRVHTTILHRAPSGTRTHEPARITQAGTPETSRETHAEPEEHRGWRWSHRHDDRDEKHRAEERRRAEERYRAEERRERKHDRDRVQCRDGRYEDVKVNHGMGRGPEVCKHHGGVAH